MLSNFWRAIGLTGVALSLTGVAQAEEIKVGILSLASHSPTMIAEGQGYFDEQGIEVEFVPFQAAQPMAVAIASGDVDFGMTALTAGLVSLAEHGAVKVIGGALQEVPDVSGQKILASPAAYEQGLDSPAKLEGKRFGITTAGSSFHYIAHGIADAEGIDRASLQVVPLNAVPAVIASLQSGQIDAWAIVPNIADRLVAEGGAFEIGTVADYIDGYQVTTVFTSAEIAANQRDLTERFLKALSSGIADYNAAFVDKTMEESEVVELVGIIHQYLYTDQPIETADVSIRAGAMRMNEGAALNMTSLEHQLDWFKSEQLVPADASMANLVDDSYAESY